MRFHTLLSVAGLVVVIAASATRVSAQESSPQHLADIRIGTCASLGEVVTTLAPLVVPEGDPQGPAGATRVAQSVTDVPLTLLDLLSASYAVTVQASPAQLGTPIACAEIGGVVSEDGTLSVGLQAMNGGKVSGVASFTPAAEGNGTTVTVLLVDERRDRERADDAVDGGDDATGGGVDGVDGVDDGVDGTTAPDGVGNVAVPPGPNHASEADGIATVDPSALLGELPILDSQPGEDGVVDRAGRGSDGSNGREGKGKRGDDEIARAGEDGRSSSSN